MPPENARLHLEPEPPVSNLHGPIAFRLMAPWMDGFLVLRFPETLHSRGRLHFIDHQRPDMVPTSTIGDIQWKQDSTGASISYETATDDGVVFGGEAILDGDEVTLRFHVRNETRASLEDISVQMCLVMSGAPDFATRHDLSRIFTWIGHRFVPLSLTTPSPACMGRPPWILLPTVDFMATYTGPLEGKDGWWMVEQRADRNVIACVSGDNVHLVAIAWDERASMLMTNTSIPCLHAGPRASFSIAPRETARWRGKLFLMPHDPDRLRVRHDAALAEWRSLTP